MLEGDTVHFPTPKNQMSKDIVLEKDTPFFATSDAPLVLINNGSIDRVNTEMMNVRWRMFKLHKQIRVTSRGTSIHVAIALLNCY